MGRAVGRAEGGWDRGGINDQEEASTTCDRPTHELARVHKRRGSHLGEVGGVHGFHVARFRDAWHLLHALSRCASARAQPTPSPPLDSEGGAESEHRLCVVCIDEAKSHLFTACGHKCVCATCAARILSNAAADGAPCPVCRLLSLSIVRVFD